MNEGLLFRLGFIAAVALGSCSELFPQTDEEAEAPDLYWEMPLSNSLNLEDSSFWPPVRQWYFHLNGYSIHFDKQPAPGERVNDFLVGLGATAEFETDGRFIWEIAGDIFLDSGEEISAVLGPTVQYPFGDHLHVGVAGFLMYKTSFQRDYGFPILPTPLPFAETGTERIRVRMYYVPPIRRSTDHQVVFQARIAL